MARAKKNAGAKGGKSEKRKAQTAASTADLGRSTREARATYTNAKKTTEAYEGYLARGKVFLKSCVAQRRKEEAREGWVRPEGHVDTDLLAKAFSKPPNKYSATALELFITQKCLVENLKKSTAEGIHGAYAKYWDTMDSDKYAGEYHYDEELDKVSGCPARAGIVASLVKIIKIRDTEKGAAATRNHAEAISADDMKVMMDWSESICPASKLIEAVKMGVAPQDLAERLLLLKHGQMRAFGSSGFNLWTRNFELCALQMRDLTLNCVGPLPFNHPYFKVLLEGRKGWQHKQGYESKRESCEYNMYPQPDLPALDMHNFLLTWIPFYELCIGRKLQPDDYIFPYIASNGVIHPDREMTLQMCQNLITEFTEGAGLKKTYTTHSFRRGGAQYRFMFAPLGKRWSLNIVRWWGGWATGEHVDTLMKYLLDSLQSYETGHGDALCPVPLEADKSFMGDHLLVRPVVTEEFRAVTSQIITHLNKLSLTPPACVCAHGSQGVLNSVASSRSGHRQFPASATTGTNAGTIPTPASTAQPNRTPTPPARDESPISKPTPLSERVEIIPGVVIPNLKKGAKAWLDAVRQWEHGDPVKGLTPLQDWPREWYSGGMRKVTGSKRSQRKLIFDEYERLERSEAEFVKLYPDAHKHISTLILAIRETNKSRGVIMGRRSKRGVDSGADSD
ncbi:hypothetical protein C8F04DRAFT_1031060 [Mycena alexandri]|uniref:Integrase n=1 Tax=Mycena alexandri TaxID=1745969 RepID=A0AAD6TAK5_9AGAR|nr:hypothetical protein C8F04DRAFT_1031060 [Mycena alexandri]